MELLLILILIRSTHSYEDNLEYCPTPLACIVLHILCLPQIVLKCPRFLVIIICKDVVGYARAYLIYLKCLDNKACVLRM